MCEAEAELSGILCSRVVNARILHMVGAMGSVDGTSEVYGPKK